MLWRRTNAALPDTLGIGIPPAGVIVPSLIAVTRTAVDGPAKWYPSALSLTAWLISVVNRMEEPGGGATRNKLGYPLPALYLRQLWLSTIA